MFSLVLLGNRENGKGKVNFKLIVKRNFDLGIIHISLIFHNIKCGRFVSHRENNVF